MTKSKQSPEKEKAASREVLPIFKTNGVECRSILTTKNEDEISDEYPVSLVSIVKKYNLKRVFVCDDSFLLFPSLYKNLKDICHVVFGVNFHCCSDVDERNAASVLSESKVTIIMKNSDGYKDLVRISNMVRTEERFMYYKPRIDWKTIEENWTDNLILMLPPYDNFLHNNLLKNYVCVPVLRKIKPILSWANMGLPFDYLIQDAVKEYGKNNKLETIEVHPTYYYKNNDFKPYVMLRAVNNRKTFSDPNLEFCTSNQFSFESYLNKIGQKIQ